MKLASSFCRVNKWVLTENIQGARTATPRRTCPLLMFFTYYTTLRVSLHRCLDRLRANRDAGVQRLLN